MISYLLKRLTSTILVLFGVLFLTFLLMYAVPGDPTQTLIGQRADAETIANLRTQWGLDKPLSVQFYRYVLRVCKGDLGNSYFTQDSISRNLIERLPYTFVLALAATLIGAMLGIPAGIISAFHRDSLMDRNIMGLTLVGISLPVFWMGILVLTFSYQMDSLSFLNRVEPLYLNIILASIVLGIRPIALISRITRVQMTAILDEDYILCAWARGLSKSRILFVHALRNCLAPILTALALDFGSLLSGAAITETIFGIPGIGKYALSGLGRRDYPVIMGMVLFSAVIFVFVNLCVDLFIPYLNPALKDERARIHS